MRASIAIPGVLPPVVMDGQVLVDGAVLNNLPTAVMRQMNGGPVIGVDMSQARGVDPHALENPPSWWKWVLSGAWKAGPPIVSILMRSATLTTDADLESSRAATDLLIEAARRTEGLLHTPSPFVLQEALGDFYVSYQINAYTDRARDQVDIYAWLRQNIQDCFNEAGIEILSPHYHAVRDGGTLAMPASARPDGYRPPGFRVAVEPADPAAARPPFTAGAGVKGAAEPGTQA